MPKFRFRAPNGVIRSRTTRTTDPGYTHATMENIPFTNPHYVSGWQLGHLCHSEAEANKWAQSNRERHPDREIIVVPRLVESPADKSLTQRVRELEEALDRLTETKT